MGLDRLFAEEETLADLAVDQALRDQLKNLDLPRRRLLFEFPERCREGDDLRATARPARGGSFEAPCVIGVATQNLVALSSVHDPAIGRVDPRL